MDRLPSHRDPTLSRENKRPNIKRVMQRRCPARPWDWHASILLAASGAFTTAERKAKSRLRDQPRQAAESVGHPRGSALTFPFRVPK